MSSLPLLPRLSFLQAEGARNASDRQTDALRSRELLAAAQLDEAELLQSIETSVEGLDSLDAEARLKANGLNVVAQAGVPSALSELWGRAKNPLNALLLFLAAASYALGEANAAIVIVVIVTLAIGMAFIQEHRSNEAAAQLRAMVKIRANVKRRGVEEDDARVSREDFKEIPSEELVPGDIVRLSAGDMVPADLRLLSAKDLFLNQSILTGESMPCEKTAQPARNNCSSLLEAPNLALMGASVVSGFATAVVLRTGAKTYFGQIAEQIAGRRPLTSFDKGVNRFIWLMIRFMMALAPAVFLINGLTKGDWIDALLFGLAVAVGLTPEMLPMIVTVNLAKGAIAMSRRRVIVKRLNAIQNFGAMDVLCADKTGTLTQNKVALSLHLDIRGKQSQRTLEYAYLNSRYQSGLKSLLDEAVLQHVEHDENFHFRHRFTCVDEIPFDFERRRLSVILSREDDALVQTQGALAGFVGRVTRGFTLRDRRRLLICKGAVEEVLAVCKSCEIDGRARRLDARRREQALESARALNEDGFRVVAVAFKETANSRARYSIDDERELVLLGFIAFLDPAKESVEKALAGLSQAGVVVKILTGDNEVVTRKICREVGLNIDRIALGPEIERLDDAELAELAEAVTVFAKVSPQQKVRIVNALHSRGHVVGFLGDGVNDSLALKAADVGVSVDAAVDIAKESADIILLEKSLLVLGHGILEGRKVFGNIIKYIKMGASSNFGSMFSVLGASALLPFLPMLPIQVLTNNLLYDFSQTAIPTDNVDEEYLMVPRKWDIDNIFRFMLFLGPISSIFDYTTFFVMLHIFDGWNNPSLFQTGWFVESLLTQTLVIHVIRTAKIPFQESWPSAALLTTSAIICAAGVALPYTAVGQLLKFTPLPTLYWPILAATLLAYGILTQIGKMWFVARWGM